MIADQSRPVADAYDSRLPVRFAQKHVDLAFRFLVLALKGMADVRQEGRGPPMSPGSGYQIAYACNKVVLRTHYSRLMTDPVPDHFTHILEFMPHRETLGNDR